MMSFTFWLFLLFFFSRSGSAHSTSPTAAPGEVKGGEWTTTQSMAAYTLIGRPDLAANLEQVAESEGYSSFRSRNLSSSSGQRDTDGTLRLLLTSRLRFSRDRRLEEVVRLLTSDKPNRIVVVRQPEDR
jgi:hypothetical protein